MAYKLPNYKPNKCRKVNVNNKIGPKDVVVRMLDVTAENYRNWGKYVPAPYADRLILSDWGKKSIEPRYVLVEDALIIFKTFPFMAKHFGRIKTWDSGMLYLPEMESAYMIRHFPNFMRVFTETELKDRHLF